eukprot:SAG22_NODE_1064_length_5756_cov_48.259502_12_plen_242_part_00
MTLCGEWTACSSTAVGLAHLRRSQPLAKLARHRAPVPTDRTERRCLRQNSCGHTRQRRYRSAHCKSARRSVSVSSRPASCEQHVVHRMETGVSTCSSDADRESQAGGKAGWLAGWLAPSCMSEHVAHTRAVSWGRHCLSVVLPLSSYLRRCLSLRFGGAERRWEHRTHLRGLCLGRGGHLAAAGLGRQPRGGAVGGLAVNQLRHRRELGQQTGRETGGTERHCRLRQHEQFEVQARGKTGS